MDKSIRIYDSHKEMKADEYRYWQSRPVHERVSAVAELTLSAYAMKEPARDVRRLQKRSDVATQALATSRAVRRATQTPTRSYAGSESCA
jgi:hypothetical protein